MLFNRPFGDGQPQSVTAGFTTAGAVDAVKFLEDFSQFCLGNSTATVFNDDLVGISIVQQLQTDCGVGSRVCERISQYIFEASL